MEKAGSSYVLPAFILGVSLIIATFFVAREVRSVKEASQVLKVVGSAKKLFTSDRGILQATLSGSGATMTEALAQLTAQKPKLLQFLAQKDFPESKVEFSPATDNHLFEFDKNGNYTGNVMRYSFSQQFKLESEKVDSIQALSLQLVDLINQGVSIKVSSPEFYYSKIADLKIDVQSLAAADAKARAVAIAKATETRLGPIRGARMGVLQITPPNSNVVSDYGVNDTTSIEKEITAVVSAEFQVH